MIAEDHRGPAPQRRYRAIGKLLRAEPGIGGDPHQPAQPGHGVVDRGEPAAAGGGPAPRAAPVPGGGAGRGAGHPPASARRMATPSARATGGGKALPTWRYAAVLRPEKDQRSGNPWRRETIATVSLGGRPGGKSGPGGWSATPRPSTPSAAQARRARVGPRSGPSCFLLPPTMVGAMPRARDAPASAPGQPSDAIRARRVSPPV